MEETGLSAHLCYRGIYHEHVVSAENGDMLEDKIFHIIGGREPVGNMKASFEGGRNCWKNLKVFAAMEKKYASADIETRLGTGQASFIEQTQIYRKDEF